MSAVPDFSAANDPDSLETKEWLDALEAVIEREGPERAHHLLGTLVDKARGSGAFIPFSANTAYVNTIPPHLEERSPGIPGRRDDQSCRVLFLHPYHGRDGLEFLKRARGDRPSPLRPVPIEINIQIRNPQFTCERLTFVTDRACIHRKGAMDREPVAEPEDAGQVSHMKSLLCVFSPEQGGMTLRAVRCIMLRHLLASEDAAEFVFFL